VAVHIANDGPTPLRARLRVALYRGFEESLDQAAIEIDLPPHAASAHNVEQLLGRFVDAAWAYRFGPATQDLIVLSLERYDDERGGLISQAFHMPAGRPTAQETPEALGIQAVLRGADDDTPVLSVSSRRLAYGVRINVPGWTPADDSFSVEPGHSRQVSLERAGGAMPSAGSVTALNLAGSVPIHLESAE
ncbi:MAG: hypothetical protein ACRDNK_19800, partial [Solirubrobacteraceae bacterium]